MHARCDRRTDGARAPTMSRLGVRKVPQSWNEVLVGSNGRAASCPVNLPGQHNLADSPAVSLEERQRTHRQEIVYAYTEILEYGVLRHITPDVDVEDVAVPHA